MAISVEQAIEDVYTSLDNNNEDIDLQIAKLKDALSAAGQKQAVFKPERLAQNNRAGRKMMQSYFKKRGVTVTFEG
jgi:hypothetical protein